MRETFRLFVTTVKELNKALSRPLRVLIIGLILSFIGSVVLLCWVIKWQRDDIRDLKGQNATLRQQSSKKDDVIEAKNKQLNEVYIDLIAELQKQNAEIQNLKK